MKFTIWEPVSCKGIFNIPEYVGNVDGLGDFAYFRGGSFTWLKNKTKIYQACTICIWWNVRE